MYVGRKKFEMRRPHEISSIEALMRLSELGLNGFVGHASQSHATREMLDAFLEVPLSAIHAKNSVKRCKVR